MGFLSLQGRLYELCLAPCKTVQHMLANSGGFLNFSDSGRDAGYAGGGITFTSFRGGGRGRWYQPRPGLLAFAVFRGRTYYLSFLPNLIAFQANVGGSAAQFAHGR